MRNEENYNYVLVVCFYCYVVLYSITLSLLGYDIFHIYTVRRALQVSPVNWFLFAIFRFLPVLIKFTEVTSFRTMKLKNRMGEDECSGEMPSWREKCNQRTKERKILIQLNRNRQPFHFLFLSLNLFLNFNFSILYNEIEKTKMMYTHFIFQ